MSQVNSPLQRGRPFGVGRPVALRALAALLPLVLILLLVGAAAAVSSSAFRAVAVAEHRYDGAAATRATALFDARDSSADQRPGVDATYSLTFHGGYDQLSNLARAVARSGEYRSAPQATPVVRHGPLNPGPLADDVANTFRSGTYNAVSSAEPTTLYRVYSDPARQLGPYWSRTRPSGPTQSIIDSALDPAWGNQATSWVQIRVPGGTTFYEGAAAAQRGLVGGGNQVFLPWVDDAWVVRSGGF